ncbi:HepT-like ribonuclease domain-containing protein [Sulfurimonas sp.]|uniref:HepT-like ribonuclease domain-containing protein n=1 Tax=Sulfurimonas sp. TaxID=2022749 RepID=UPI003D0DC538
MFDKSLVIEILTQIIDAIEIVEERCKFAKTQDDFCDTKEGQEKLDGICMKLIAVGESLKNIDKITDKKLLEQYPTIEWKKIKGIRDFISHHYFDLDADVIFDVCQNEIEELLLVLKKMKNDLLK